MDSIPSANDPNILVGFETADDGAVYRLSDDLALVQSLDVLTPVVDDPYDYGRIAAANSVSDIYAMGGVPRFALSFAAFPKGIVPMDVLARIIEGAARVAIAEGMPIIGGHTIDDKEPKFGLCVTGIVHPDRIVTNAAGADGDLLVLTKPLGSGVITTAAKRGLAPAETVARAVEMMATTNAAGARAMAATGVRCATDVTGFGLLGHLHEVAEGSQLAAELYLDAIPILEGARALADADLFPGGSRRNLAWLGDAVTLDAGVTGTDALILADAQTSGGLLIAIAEARLEELLAALEGEGVGVRAVVGRLGTGAPGAIHVRTARPAASC